MHPILRNVLAVVAGWLAGTAVNLGIVALGHAVLPLEGVDPNDLEALAAAMPSMSAGQFAFPFLAHALGTLVGAFVAAKLAATRPLAMALVVGAVFLAGGIYMAVLLPAPLWFEALDVLLAYLPMAWLGGRLARA